MANINVNINLIGQKFNMLKILDYKIKNNILKMEIQKVVGV